MAAVFRLSDFYDPLPKQREFHESPAKYKCYMGGVGSGKTTALVMEALMLSLEYPRNYGLIGRYTYPELRDTTMFEFMNAIDGIHEHLQELYGSSAPRLIKSFMKTEHKLTLINDSVIIFRHLEEPDKIKSLNLGWFGIDEGTEIPEDVFMMLQSRLRKKEVPRRVGFMSTNPEGRDWVWHKWCVLHKGDPDYLFIRAPSYENKHLPEDYIDDLVKSYPEHWRKRYIEGDPAAFAGQIITTWDERQHVIEPFEIPREWAQYVGLDHGTNNPTAVLWMAVNPEGFKIIYREHYEAGQIIDHHAKRIIELNGSDDITAWYADPAIFNRTLQDPRRGLHSVADEYAEHGLHFIHGDNDVKSGINKLIDNFNIWPNLVNPFTQQLGSPKIFIFKDCENTIYEIPQYRWKDQRVRGRYRARPEEPEKANDHTVDVTRYLLMSNPLPAREKVRPLFKSFPTRHEKVWNALEKRSKLHRSRRLAGLSGSL